jgi:uncharacterized membrane protein YbhN (UPF0104 family)
VNLKRTLFKHGPKVISILVAIGMIIFLIRSDILRDIDFRSLNWWAFGALIVCRLLSWGVMGLSIAFLLKPSAIQLDFTEWYGLIVGGLLFNKLVPTGGGAMAVRAGYLKARYQFPITHYVAMWGAVILVNAFISGLLGVVALVWLSGLLQSPIPLEGVALLLALSLSSVIAVALPWGKIPLNKNNPFIEKVYLVIEGWHRVRTYPNMLALQISLTVILQLILGLMYYFSYASLGQQSTYIGSLFLSALANISRILPIQTFFGLKELIAGLGTQMVGQGLDEGVKVALLIRVGDIIANVIVGPIFLYLLSQRIGSWFARK